MCVFKRHLGSRHGCEGVGGSENRLVVHHWLRSHHWYPAHLTHLGRDLEREEGVEIEKDGHKMMMMKKQQKGMNRTKQMGKKRVEKEEKGGGRQTKETIK